MPHPVILYDGVCGLCDRSVRFVLRHDHAGRFRFAPLQGEFAARALARHGRDAADLDTVYLLDGERLLAKSDAVCAILDALGGAWRLLALLRVLPRALRDRAYDAVAGNRYRWFGRFDACALPPPHLRERFLAAGLDADAPAETGAPGAASTSRDEKPEQTHPLRVSA